MKRFATLALLLSFVALTLVAQTQESKTPDKDADNKQAVAAAAAGKKDQKKPAKDEKKEEPEKKGGMTADTFSGLKFRLIGPAVASGRVMSIAI